MGFAFTKNPDTIYLPEEVAEILMCQSRIISREFPSDFIAQLINDSVKEFSTYIITNNFPQNYADSILSSWPNL